MLIMLKLRDGYMGVHYILLSSVYMFELSITKTLENIP